jgi:DNA-binding transcriptional ArsR family regulator
MKGKKADMMLHPVRMRIIQALLSYDKMTVQQLLEKLNDIPQATMYRHLKQLHDAELIEVIETNKIRGTIEKTYAVKKDNISLTEVDLEDTTAEDHLRYFMTYQANLLKEFEHYVMAHKPDQFKEDGLGYWQMILQLTEEEMNEFGKELSDVVQKYAKKKPSMERSPRTFATIFIPQK